MKRNATLILLVATVFFHLNAKAYAQGITIKVTDVTIDKVFSMIQKQTSFVFVYSGKQLAGTKKVSVNVVNEKLEKVMEVVMDGQPLKYEIDKEYVIIKQKAAAGEIALNKLPGELTGKVTNEKGEPVAGATVTVKNSNIYAVTDANGNFTLKGVDPKAELVISSVSFATKTVQLAGEENISIKMSVSATTIETVVVKGSTGYQAIDRKQHPGSFDIIDNKLLNRSLGPNILERIKDLTPGVLFDNRSGVTDPIIIRGRNSIGSSIAPLIVLDNFPYQGDIQNINPNDVESITILKDAAAASIWGARAGNGVIVIATKRGKGGRPQINLNSTVSFLERPDLYYQKNITSEDYIQFEQNLYSLGVYNSIIRNRNNPGPLTPVIELLEKVKNGVITSEQGQDAINKLKAVDYRDDLKNYFYRTGVGNQNSASISGATGINSYYLGFGWDNMNSTNVGSSNGRISINANNTFRATKNLSIDLGVTYTRITSEFGNVGSAINSGAGKSLYPYADLVDPEGNAQVLVKNYRSTFIDTVRSGNLLDWKYRPYDEIHSLENRNKTSDFLINAALKFQILNLINFEIRYQFENQKASNRSLSRLENFTTRDLINRYFQPNSLLKFPIPIGDMLTLNNSELLSHQGRVSANINKTMGRHSLNSLVGLEINAAQYISDVFRFYGYQAEGSTVTTNMDFFNRYSLLLTPNVKSSIPNLQDISESNSRFVSYFANLAYQYEGRYSLYASARKDAANILGVQTNNRTVPLWSIGVGWDLSKEKFYNFSVIPEIRLRATYGYSGNFNSNVSAKPIIVISQASNEFGLTTAMLQSPPIQDLRWERNGRLNIGADFSSKNQIVSGSIEVYYSNNKDLISPAPVDPTLGLSSRTILRNVASMKGKGIEINLNTKNISTKKFNWQTTFNFSYAFTKVTKLYTPSPTAAFEYLGGGANAIIGQPLYTWYSYKWAGLDPTNGDPRGFIGKDISTDYGAIQQLSPDELRYHGVATPPYFGSLRNAFNWKGIGLSLNISGRFGYYFRNSSISYSSLFNTWNGHGDYSNRWVEEGDEKKTNVPSFKYPISGARDAFYLNSEVLIARGDHIRLEDIRLSYSLDKEVLKGLPFQQARLILYISNLNVIMWRANADKVDPNFISGPLIGRNVALGVNLSF